MVFTEMRVRRLLLQWEPREWYDHEAGFTEDVLAFLREHFDEATADTPPGGVDIKVTPRIGLEVERGLTAERVGGTIDVCRASPFFTVFLLVGGATDKAWDHLVEQTLSHNRASIMSTIIALRWEPDGRKDAMSSPALLGG